MKKAAKKTTKKAKVQFDDILDPPPGPVTSFGVPSEIAARIEQESEAETDWLEAPEATQDEPMEASLVKPTESNEKPVKTPSVPGIEEPFDFAYAAKVVHDLWQGTRFIYQRAKRKVSFLPDDVGILTQRTDRAVQLIELLKREAEKQGGQ
jgi:hypothetical protein